MNIYLTGERERQNPNHVMQVAPAADKRVAPNGIPSDWLDDDKKPRTFPIVFRYGKAVVEDNLGAYLVKTGQASASSLLKPQGRSILGAFADRVRPATTQY
jgi:hypothetical protein